MGHFFPQLFASLGFLDIVLDIGMLLLLLFVCCEVGGDLVTVVLLSSSLHLVVTAVLLEFYTQGHIYW